MVLYVEEVSRRVQPHAPGGFVETVRFYDARSAGCDCEVILTLTGDSLGRWKAGDRCELSLCEPPEVVRVSPSYDLGGEGGVN